MLVTYHIGAIAKDEAAVHCIFFLQALQYLRKVCNHPKLVLKPRHPEFERITAKLMENNSSLSDISHSAKLPALKYVFVLLCLKQSWRFKEWASVYSAVIVIGNY